MLVRSRGKLEEQHSIEMAYYFRFPLPHVGDIKLKSLTGLPSLCDVMDTELSRVSDFSTSQIRPAFALN
ncbi:unnamed protein product [Pieris macdunnoughi]|uniref:Uncharacterized protein n=1 Tax=Pieris macdunnoughi TaxID=345717 RepID=A0A821NJI6_9NEOP|nr:unnamed protein product [Pieris macdunnoughi]